MGKVNLLHLYPDMSFTENKKSTNGDNVKINKNESPSFTLGRSVFREEIPRWKRIFLGRKARNLLILLDGANACFELHDGVARELESNKHHLWERKEKEKFVSKVMAKKIAEQKMISTTHFLILAGMLGIIIVLQVLLMRGVHVV